MCAIAQFRREGPLTAKDADWVKDNFDNVNALCANSERFRLALESSADWRYAGNPRLAIGRLWSGIESLIGVSSELVFRVALIAASLLARRGARRKQKFDEVRRLYSLRSKAVHGDSLSTESLTKATYDSFALLRDLLLLTVEQGHELTQRDFDEAVFY